MKTAVSFYVWNIFHVFFIKNYLNGNKIVGWIWCNLPPWTRNITQYESCSMLMICCTIWLFSFGSWWIFLTMFHLQCWWYMSPLLNCAISLGYLQFVTSQTDLQFLKSQFLWERKENLYEKILNVTNSKIFLRCHKLQKP
jgi:hypothetical protein